MDYRDIHDDRGRWGDRRPCVGERPARGQSRPTPRALYRRLPSERRRGPRCPSDLSLGGRTIPSSVAGPPYRLAVDDPSDVLTFVGFDRRKKAFRMNLVPFFAARGLGMSVGRPTRIDLAVDPSCGISPCG